MSNRSRTLVALVLFLTISSPMAARSAQREPRSPHVVVDPVSRLWDRITAPVVQFIKGRGALDPNGGSYDDVRPGHLQHGRTGSAGPQRVAGFVSDSRLL